MVEILYNLRKFGQVVSVRNCTASVKAVTPMILLLWLCAKRVLLLDKSHGQFQQLAMCF